MMRKKLYFCILVVVAQLWMLTTCMDDHDPPGNEIPEGAISVEEAEAFFNEQMIRMGETNSGKELHGFATNFTPQWKDAVISGRDGMVSVDIPIITDFLYKAIVLANDTSKVEKFTTDLLQKLIVVKNLKTGSMGSYVVSIVPDKVYAQSRRKPSAMDFTNYGDYGNFSGRIIYSLPLSPVPLRVNRYREGILTDAASVFGSLDNPSELQNAGDKMKELLYGFWLKRKLRTTLRSWEFDGNAWSGGGWTGEDIVITPGGGGGGSGGELPGHGGWPPGTVFPDPVQVVLEEEIYLHRL